MGEVFIWHLFNQVAIKPFVFGEPTNQEILQRTLTEEIPHILDYLETETPAEGFLCGSLSIADISVACFFRNAGFARYRVDASRWPKTAALVSKLLAHPSFAKLAAFEERLIRTPPPQQREALAALGAPLLSETYGTNVPRRGIMQI
jgi:glutathione S-transferase